MAHGLRVEADLEALLSPIHLALFVSGILVVSSPLRAAWADPDSRTLPLPALLSTTILTATVAFFSMHFSPFLTDAMRAEPYPTLLLLRRWRLPAGSLTLLFGVVVALVSSLTGFEMEETIAAGVVAGAAGDLLSSALQPSRSPAAVLRVVGFAVPVVLWLTYFAVVATFYSVGWSVDLWSGITVMSGLAGLALATLMTLAPPAEA